MVQRRASGLDAVALATELLHRVRLSDPDAGIWEAADIQWWWRMPRRSDEIEQLFWFDREGPVAGVLLIKWTQGWGLDPIVLPGAAADLLDDVWSVAVRRLDELLISDVETLVRDDDHALAALMHGSGFAATDERSAEAWMDATDRPAVPELPDGFELLDRLTSGDRPHPMVSRSGPSVEPRLRELSLYDPALDLSIRAPNGETAAYALFWFDPVTRVGLLEPMRTEDEWQRRGLARTLLAAGLDRLARKGATRLKVGYESDAARNLYLGAGFRVAATMTTYARRRSISP